MRIFTSIVAAMLVLAGCASAPKPAQVAGTIEASTQLNPSASKRPSPVLVRVYELKSAASFNSADFMSLYERDQQALSTDLLGRDEYLVAPGESKKFNKTLAPDTRFIGVVAAFRDLERSRWRSVVAIQPGQKQQLLIRAAELSVDASIKR